MHEAVLIRQKFGDVLLGRTENGMLLRRYLNMKYPELLYLIVRDASYFVFAIKINDTVFSSLQLTDQMIFDVHFTAQPFRVSAVFIATLISF